MSQMKHVQSALGWWLIGLLLTQVLINFIGFISPFWNLWLHPEDHYGSRDLLHSWQPIATWFSIAFVPAFWYLAKAFESVVARVCTIALGVLVPMAHISSTFAQRAMMQADPSVPRQLSGTVYMFADMYVWLAFVVFIALVWWAVRQANHSIGKPLRESV